jgi:hypothetical protein
VARAQVLGQQVEVAPCGGDLRVAGNHRQAREVTSWRRDFRTIRLRVTGGNLTPRLTPIRMDSGGIGGTVRTSIRQIPEQKHGAASKRTPHGFPSHSSLERKGCGGRTPAIWLAHRPACA